MASLNDFSFGKCFLMMIGGLRRAMLLIDIIDDVFYCRLDVGFKPFGEEGRKFTAMLEEMTEMDQISALDPTLSKNFIGRYKFAKEKSEECQTPEDLRLIIQGIAGMTIDKEE